jgi:hypothetical protein
MLVVDMMGMNEVEIERCIAGQEAFIYVARMELWSLRLAP